MAKKRYATYYIKDEDLSYGGDTGVTKAEARKAFIEGFASSARKHKSKYKGLSGIAFRW